MDIDRSRHPPGEDEWLRVCKCLLRERNANVVQPEAGADATRIRTLPTRTINCPSSTRNFTHAFAHMYVSSRVPSLYRHMLHGSSHTVYSSLQKYFNTYL